MSGQGLDARLQKLQVGVGICSSSVARVGLLFSARMLQILNPTQMVLHGPWLRHLLFRDTKHTQDSLYGCPSQIC